jgi:hypothetical protein
MYVCRKWYLEAVCIGTRSPERMDAPHLLYCYACYTTSIPIRCMDTKAGIQDMLCMYHISTRVLLYMYMYMYMCGIQPSSL